MKSSRSVLSKAKGVQSLPHNVLQPSTIDFKKGIQSSLCVHCPTTAPALSVTSRSDLKKKQQYSVLFIDRDHR